MLRVALGNGDAGVNTAGLSGSLLWREINRRDGCGNPGQVSVFIIKMTPPSPKLPVEGRETSEPNRENKSYIRQ